eukprot:gene17937-biopygen20410
MPRFIPLRHTALLCCLPTHLFRHPNPRCCAPAIPVLSITAASSRLPLGQGGRIGGACVTRETKVTRTGRALGVGCSTEFKI